MTAEEFKEKYYPEGCRDWMFVEALSEFAELKCKELLEIVAKKAETKKEGNSGSWYDAKVDKDSILNAVNLKELVK
jgi:hypothetical protein